MLVSVVIGALNEEKYIGATINSVKAQKTRHKIELIVGDGYSEDATVKIAKKMGAKVVKEKNRSAAWERQAGTKVARGEVIAFTDADAKVPSDWVEKIAAEFSADPNLCLLYGPVYFSDAGPLDYILSKTIMPAFMLLTSLVGAHNTIGSNFAVRLSVFEKAGGFNTSLRTAEDLDLTRRMERLGGVKYLDSLSIDVSARRVKKWGYPRFVAYHIANAIKYHLTGKSHSDYEDVR